MLVPRLGLVGSLVLVASCAHPQAQPGAQQPATPASTTSQASLQAAWSPTPPPLAPTPPNPAPGADGLPALPSSTAPAPSAPATTPPAPAAPTVFAVTMNDELPFTASSHHHESSTSSTTAPSSSSSSSSSNKEGHATVKHSRRAHGNRHHEHRPYHPDPGVIVDVTAATGDATQVDAQRLARANGYWPFRHCYEEGLRRLQQLGGRVSFELSIGADGVVKSTSKTSSTLSDESVALCVMREASHLSLVGTPTQPSQISMQVALAPGDAPVPVPRGAPRAETTREELRAKWPQVEACYKTGLEKKQDLGGRLALKFHVKGEEIEVSEHETRFPDVDVTRCVLGVYRQIKFSHTRHELAFVYPLHFEAVASTAPVASNVTP